jgi:hypothetical protein
MVWFLSGLLASLQNFLKKKFLTGLGKLVFLRFLLVELIGKLKRKQYYFLYVSSFLGQNLGDLLLLGGTKPAPFCSP